MKKLAIAVVTTFATAAIAVGVASGNPDAGTVVDRGFACGVLDGAGNTFITEDSTLTVYQRKAVLRCTGWGAPAPRLTFWNYHNTELTCGSPFGSTTNWEDKVGRLGNSQLVCVFHLNGDDVDSASAGTAGLG